MAAAVKWSPRVAVVGAGIAGIGAARTLYQAGFTNVIVLEATGRIGGRICTHYDKDSDADPYKIEMGANWIHGKLGNPLYNIANEHQLLETLACQSEADTSRYACIHLAPGGKMLPYHIFRDVASKYQEFVQECEQFFEDGLPAEEFSEDIGFEEFMLKRMADFLGQYTGDDRANAKGVVDHLLIYETSLCGCSTMKTVSAHQLGSYVALPGPDIIIGQGFEKIVHTLAKDIPQENILLNHAVTQIITKRCCDAEAGGPGSIKATSVTDECAAMEIQCSDGSVISADCVLFTGSLGFLKRHHTSLFSPALPQTKQHAIDKIHIGTVDKIFLEYDTLDFLPARVETVRLLRSAEDRQCEGGNAADWTRKIVAFNVVHKPKRNMICAWITGLAAELMETLSLNEVAEGCTRLLQDFLGKKHIPLPRRVIRSQWGTNPYTLGSYSCIPVNASVEDLKELTKPICHPHTHKPLVLFAGEALSTESYGASHGALATGQQQAHTIITAFQSQLPVNKLPMARL